MTSGLREGERNQTEGRYHDTYETLDKLCSYLGCTIEDILEYKPDSPADNPQTGGSKESETADGKVTR